VAEYDACDEATAATIADNANQFEAEIETDRSVDEWLSFMNDSGQERPVHAWNWAIGYVDPKHWDDTNPYKINP
jgi:hypothetical protein